VTTNCHEKWTDASCENINVQQRIDDYPERRNHRCGTVLGDWSRPDGLAVD